MLRSWLERLIVIATKGQAFCVAATQATRMLEALHSPFPYCIAGVVAIWASHSFHCRPNYFRCRVRRHSVCDANLNLQPCSDGLVCTGWLSGGVRKLHCSWWLADGLMFTACTW